MTEDAFEDAFIERLAGKIMYVGEGKSLDIGGIRQGDIARLETESTEIRAEVIDPSDPNRIRAVVQQSVPRSPGESSHKVPGDSVEFAERHIHSIERKSLG